MSRLLRVAGVLLLLWLLCLLPRFLPHLYVLGPIGCALCHWANLMPFVGRMRRSLARILWCLRCVTKRTRKRLALLLAL
ncbi:hypothetical protein SS1G_05234 [Sclerotinia sclerotiorum 1980 UF-70]|uniref:Uncharacterized protein n=1 Tax=Sclerotinia sclerotiorum (strain ATCC 18683 / 1980 / Ss-1) TaxID=665079 RepID=A7EIU1_SCLS1|nr:hypothetical protein SS1G_05234 [Sclerotinia sclerotiorum 1980 UF-70]EDO02757.1 hypothetical protein SS1G_05234 [Sclerotinia sclerotiorum 1980 UF-70]